MYRHRSLQVGPKQRERPEPEPGVVLAVAPKDYEYRGEGEWLSDYMLRAIYRALESFAKAREGADDPLAAFWLEKARTVQRKVELVWRRLKQEEVRWNESKASIEPGWAAGDWEPRGAYSTTGGARRTLNRATTPGRRGFREIGRHSKADGK